jgi:hypothetical protein
VTASGITQGILGGAIAETEFSTKVYPAMAASFTQVITHDCTQLASPPTCGCAMGSTGQELVQLFDQDPSDCAITPAEVEGNSLIRALFMPDVTVDGQMALSVGFGVTAVGATFTVN